MYLVDSIRILDYISVEFLLKCTKSNNSLISTSFPYNLNLIKGFNFFPRPVQVSLLSLCVFIKDVKMLSIVLRYADVVDCNTITVLCVQTKFLDGLKLLTINKNYNKNYNKNIDNVDKLVRNSMTYNSTDCMSFLLELDGNRKFVSEYCDISGAEVPLLKMATDRKYNKMVKILLDNGFNPNITDYDGVCVLKDAINYSNMTAAKYLIEAGANINHKCSINDCYRSSTHIAMCTPLIRAVVLCNIDFVNMFISHNVNVNTSDWYGNVILTAVECN